MAPADPLALVLAPDVTAAARGDREAFTRLVDATRGVVCAIALAILRDVEASKDVAQDVYLAAWTGVKCLRDPISFLPWLRQITRNRAHHVLRTERHRHLATDADLLLAAAADPRPRADDVLISRELREQHARALDELPHAAREVMILYYREGQSVRHVAELLGLSEAAVKQRLSRGRARLRDAVLPEPTDELLRTTAPTDAFTANVVMAMSTTAKGAAAAATAGVIGAVAGGVFGVLGKTRRLRALARDAEERRGIRQYGQASIALALIFAATFLTPDFRVVTLAFLACFAAFCVLQFVWLPRVIRRRLAAELEENPEAWRMHRRRRRYAVLGCIAGFVLGGAPLAWAWWHSHVP